MRVLLAMLFLCGSNAAPDKPPTADGFVSLFPNDGVPKGWLVRRWDDISQPAHEGVQWMRDGVLHGSPSRGTWLISEKQYGDFILEFDFKLGPRGNSGCALRTPLSGDPAFDGMELQMADLRYNTRAKPSELTGGIYRAIPPKQQAYRPTQWNHYRIELRKEKLRVELNDVLIHDLNLCEQKQEVRRHDGTLAPTVARRPPRGHIGFQELSRGPERVQIRNARIAATTEESPPKR